MLKTIDPLGNVSSATYDSNNNLLSATGPTNLTATFSYDSQGNLLSSKNAAGQTVTFTYGSLDRMTGMTDANGNTTTYAYDASGNLLKITNPNGAAETATLRCARQPANAPEPERPDGHLYLQLRRTSDYTDLGRRIGHDVCLRLPRQSDNRHRFDGHNHAQL